MGSGGETVRYLRGGGMGCFPNVAFDGGVSDVGVSDVCRSVSLSWKQVGVWWYSRGAHVDLMLQERPHVSYVARSDFSE